MLTLIFVFLLSLGQWSRQIKWGQTEEVQDVPVMLAERVETRFRVQTDTSRNWQKGAQTFRRYN